MKKVSRSVVLHLFIVLAISTLGAGLLIASPWIIVGIISLMPSEEHIYHKPAIINSQNVKKIQKETGGCYFVDGLEVYESTVDNKLKKSDVLNDKGIASVYSSSYDDEFLFFYCLTKQEVFGGDKGIVVFNNSFEMILFLREEYNVSAMTIFNGFLYCYCNYYLAEKHQSFYCLIKYDIETLERTVLTDDFGIGDIINDNGLTLFLHYTGGNDLQLYKTTDGKYSCLYSSFACYETNKKVINGRIDNNFLKINYLDVEFSFRLPYETSYFCDNVYVNEDYLLFGVREYLFNDECDSTFWSNRCICHYGRSSLFKYDFETQKLFLIDNYKTGTVLLDYEEGESKYYCDGHFYINDASVKDCSTIKPNGLITIEGDNHKSSDRDYWFIGFEKNSPYLFVFEP